MTLESQLPLSFEHRPSLSGEDFIIAPCNAEAMQWIDQWPKWSGPILALSGPQGCGKSHLISVFANKTKPQVILPDKLETILNMAINGQSNFVMDNAESVINSQSEEIFFHLINVLQGSEGRLLMASRAPPARWRIHLPDLASRLRAIQVVAITRPDDKLVASLLVKFFSDRQLRIDLDVIDYLVPRIDRSFDSIYEQVKYIDSRALMCKRKITIPFVREVLDEKSHKVYVKK